MRNLIAIWVIVLLGGRALAADHPCASGTQISGELDAIGRGGTFRLAGVKQDFVLADIVVEEIGETLDLPAGELVLFFLSRSLDRYGRLPVHAFHKGAWIQQDILRRGKALTLIETNDRNCRKALLDAESKNTARKGNYWRAKGIEFRATDLDLLSTKAGYFVLVTGVVRSIGDRSRRLYLNFGENWAHDFTVSIAKQGAGKFKGSMGFLTQLKDKKVLVRGVLENNQGPLIRVIDETQIQIIN
ncbi:MAG: hypothetical protein GKR97_13215 [Rhizobiaceae bacterium]|nr:hypothetical protein [Rhizobiaceae bacterium]